MKQVKPNIYACDCFRAESAQPAPEELEAQCLKFLQECKYMLSARSLAAFIRQREAALHREIERVSREWAKEFDAASGARTALAAAQERTPLREALEKLAFKVADELRAVLAPPAQRTEQERIDDCPQCQGRRGYLMTAVDESKVLRIPETESGSITYPAAPPAQSQEEKK
jgi:hypothetical protein